MSKLVKATLFVKDYPDISIENIYVKLCNGHKYIHKVGKEVYVDEIALVRRRAFYAKVWNICCDNYYELKPHLNDNKQAKILSKVTGDSKQSWNTYLGEGMFSIGWLMDKNITSYEVSEKLWTYFRVSSFLIRRTKRLWK